MKTCPLCARERKVCRCLDAAEWERQMAFLRRCNQVAPWREERCEAVKQPK